MDWSHTALKLTLGVGTLGVVAVLSDALEPYLGIWGMIAFVLVPLTILAFVKVGELPAWMVKTAHGLAVTWYLALVAGSVGLMASRGFNIPDDVLMGLLMALGLAPCVAILGGILRGTYDGEGS